MKTILLNTDIFHFVRKLNTHLLLKGSWIFIWPRLTNLLCPLHTPDGCNSLFFFYCQICEFDWWMDICMQLWMSERAVSLWLTGMNTGIHVFHWKLFVLPCIFVVLLSFKKTFVSCFSLSLYRLCTYLHVEATVHNVVTPTEFPSSQNKFLYFFRYH